MGMLHRHTVGQGKTRHGVVKRKLKAIIFDVDETIVPGAVNAYTYVATLIGALARETGLGQQEILSGFQQQMRDGVYALSYALNSHQSLRDKYGPGVDLVKKFRHVIDETHRKHNATLGPLQNILTALYRLKAQGITLVIATEGPASATLGKLEFLGISDLFDHIYTVHEKDPDPKYPLRRMFPSRAWGRVKTFRKSFKTRPDAYKTMAKDMKLHPSEIAMVGDKPMRDNLMAAKAGMRTVRVTYYTDWRDDTPLRDFFNLIGAGARYTSPLDEARPHAHDPDMVPDLILDKAEDIARIPSYMELVDRGVLKNLKKSRSNNKSPRLKP